MLWAARRDGKAFTGGEGAAVERLPLVRINPIPKLRSAQPTMMSVAHWSETARAAEEQGDWDRAISVVGAVAECYSSDYERHDAHLWYTAKRPMLTPLP